MADRYWVGGTGNWDGTTTHWSATSGGAGGASVPTNADNVIFNSASNATAYTVSITASSACLDLTMSNPASGVIAVNGSGALSVAGSFSAPAGSTWAYLGVMTFSATSSGKTITSNGITYTHDITFNGVGGSWTLQDAINGTSTAPTIIHSNGDFTLNNFNINCRNFAASGGGTRSLNLGSGTWTLNASTPRWNVNAAGLTINPSTSTIKLMGTATANANVFTGGGKTYNILHCAMTSSNVLSGNNTFNEIKVDAGQTIQITAGSTQTAVTINGVGGTAASKGGFKSSSNGSPWTLSHPASLTAQFVSLQDCTSSGGPAVASNSTNVSGNTNWTFTNVPMISGISTIQGASTLTF